MIGVEVPASLRAKIDAAAMTWAREQMRKVGEVAKGK